MVTDCLTAAAVRAVLVLSVAGAVVACGAVASSSHDAGSADAGSDHPLGTDSGSGGDGGSDANQAACNLSAPFGTPTLVPGIDTASDEITASFSPDELTAYVRAVPSFDGGVGGHDILIATRASRSDAFGGERVLANVSTPGDDASATTTGDGLRIFTSNNSSGNYDIYVATRTTLVSDFGVPATVSGLATADDEVDPWISRDGTIIYFARSPANGNSHIYTALAPSGAFSAPTQVAELSSSTNEDLPVVSDDQLTIYFMSDRSGQRDIWMSTRAVATDGWGAPTSVAELNTPYQELPSWLSPDKCRLYFGSDRPGGMGGRDIYVAERGR
jgi:Tol biopolymer transport system component